MYLRGRMLCNRPCNDNTPLLLGHELQAALNGLNHYCNIWKLKVNVSKTKVVIFANRQPKQLPQFRLGNLVIDVTTDYTYLGMYIKFNENMLEGIMQLKKQATEIPKARAKC